MRLENYKYSKKASTIKSVFQSEEMYIDYHNGIFEDAINYCKKDRNRCSKHNRCRCDFFDLTKICCKCDESCLEFRTFARVDDNSGTAPHIIKELYNTIRDSQKKSFKRCFTPCNIYIWGDSRTGKDYLTQLLFPDTYHKSHDDKHWFEGYKEDKIDYVIEVLDDNEKYDSDASMSSLSSNDSETTRRRKKEKT
ncbi:18575_t:CDS:2, partial [Racocetra persica]